MYKKTATRSVIPLLFFVAWSLMTTNAFAQISFQESSVAAGLSTELYDTGHAHGLGVSWIDYDNDGWPDIFATNGAGMDVHLFRNNKDGTFSNKDSILPSLSNEEKTAAVFADYDNDGDLDIYITVNNSLGNPDGEANILWQNQWVENGNAESTPMFIDVAVAAGVDNAFGTEPGHQSLTASWLDYNVDSCIDLFVGNMVFFEGGLPSNNNALYMNNCDGTFTNVTIASGVNPETDVDWYRPTLTAFGGLMDPNDNLPDLYVTNVHDASPWHHDQQFRNNGDGTFTEMVTSMPGIGDDSGAGMGIDLADIDNDGDWDIYMTDLQDPGNEPVAEGNPFYTGNPDGTWNENSAPAAGITGGGSWGIVWVDFDQDGFEDLLVGTGDPIVYHNNGDGTFTNVTGTSGLPSFGGSSRGLAAADYDKDGDQDVVVIHDGFGMHLYENITSNSNNYLQVSLDATQSNLAGINTLVKTTAGGVTRMRQVKGALSAHSQSELILEFGIGSATVVDNVDIFWPSGEVTNLTGVGINQTITVTEPSGSGGTDLFTDVSTAAGVSVTHDGALFPVVGDPRKGTGAVWFDYDNDGDQDLYTTMRTQANFLYRNNGDGTFTNVAASAGVENATGDGAGVVAADYDNDGDKDLFLANGNEDVLYKNNGDGTFTDITAGSGLDATLQHRASSASWGDYDNDGFVDLYLSNHTAVAGNTVDGINGQDYIFHNNGDDTFTDVSDMLMGVDREGRSFIGGFTDFDKDGDLDVFKVNDCPTSSTDPTEFFRNDGGTDGLTDWTFTEVSASIGADWCQQGMGLAMGDYDRDQDTDLFFTDNGNTSPTSANVRAGAVMLRNDGGTYTEVTDASMTDSDQITWGANFFDYDLDGWLDLYVASGGMQDLQTVMNSYLYENNGDGTFADVSTMSGGLDTHERTRTSAFADYDADGDPDMFIVNYEGQMQLFRNDNSNGNNWAIFDLQGVASNRDGIGAKIEVETSDGVTQYHEVRSGSSLGAGDDTGAYFGFASAGSITSVTVTWPSGTVQVENGLGMNQRHLIVENGGGGGSTLAASPLSVDFGQVVVGQTSAPVAVTLTNTGSADIDVSNISLAGDDAAEFGHDFGGSLLVPAGGQSTVNVTFSPSTISAPLAGTVVYKINNGGVAISDFTEDTDANPSAFVNVGDTQTEGTNDVMTLDASVPVGTPMEIFQTLRRDAAKATPDMNWDFPVTSGKDYEVRMYFAENSRCSVGGRIFDVVAEGNVVLDDLDVFVEGGSVCNTGIMRSFIVTAGDSEINISMPLVNSRPSMVSAIEVTELDGTGTGGPKTAQMVIDHNGTNGSQTVDLTGEGIEDGGGSSTLTASPLNVDFGQVVYGQTSAPVAVTLTNTGTADVDVTNISLAGAEPAEFGHDFGGSLLVPAGTQSTVNVTFSPVSSGAAPAPLADVVVYKINNGGVAMGDFTEDTATNPSAFVNTADTQLEGTNDVMTLDASVPAGTPMEIFQSIRRDAAKATPDMEWDFPVTVGKDYEVRLYFAENSRCTVGGRIFDVVVEGNVELDDLDVFVEGGSVCNTGIMRSFTITAGDANLDIDMPLVNSRPSMISAIEIIEIDDGGTGTTGDRSAQLIIEHNGTNGTQTVELAGEGVDSGGNIAPTAAFTFAATDLSVDFTDASTDSDGTIASWSWDFGDGNSSTDQNPTHVYAAAGTFSVTLTVTDDGGLSGNLSQDVTVTDGGTGGTGAFIESAGMVVMEAENFHQNIAKGAHVWVESTTNADFSGASAMLSDPDNNVTIKKNGAEASSPELIFDVDFTTTGNFIVWARVFAPNAQGSTVHLGLDDVISASKMETTTTGAWTWINVNTKGAVQTVNVGTAGLHTINVWMRADGLSIDKIVLATDAGFVPTGQGPAESPQATGPVVAGNGVNGKDMLELANEVEELPESFDLKHNYPNPFNPTTTIAFDLPEASDVTLEVYDMMGRRVATLVNGNMAAGRYEANWNSRADNGSAVASGVYIYRLRAGSYESVKQMVLMK